MLIVLLGNTVRQTYATEPDRPKTPDKTVFTKNELLEFGYKLSNDRSCTINNLGFLAGSIAHYALSNNNPLYSINVVFLALFAKTHFKPTTEEFCNKFLCTFILHELTKIAPIKKHQKIKTQQILTASSVATTSAIAAYDFYLFPKIIAQKEKRIGEYNYCYDEMTLQKIFWSSDKFQTLDAKISLRK